MPAPQFSDQKDLGGVPTRRFWRRSACHNSLELEVQHLATPQISITLHHPNASFLSAATTIIHSDSGSLSRKRSGSLRQKLRILSPGGAKTELLDKERENPDAIRKSNAFASSQVVFNDLLTLLVQPVTTQQVVLGTQLNNYSLPA
ncbi:hypothetical protein PM082_015234 [Marasmius tenuissimus]|nr:hypothetical protein PM082_015234 [Marasmius tenuissimus]